MNDCEIYGTALASRERIGTRILFGLKLAFAALSTGSRMIPLGDNGALLRELAARSACAGRFEARDARIASASNSANRPEAG